MAKKKPAAKKSPSQNNGEVVIEINDMNKWYGDFHVLRDINLKVNKGERIVICGPSGSGKSTMIRCINRLEEHQKGDIIVDGVELNNDLKNIDTVRREVGMVFQHFNLFPHLTILENCALAPMWVRKEPRKEADLVIGAVLAPGAAAPKLVTKNMLSTMKDGSVIVDVAIDQGGCFETSKPTTHDDPTYVVDGIIHYCVANMPGAVARTSTFALNAATLPFVIALANKGWPEAGKQNPHLLNGLNVWKGKLTCLEAGEALGIETITPEQTLS
jgi:hypothetical protein